MIPIKVFPVHDATECQMEPEPAQPEELMPDTSYSSRVTVRIVYRCPESPSDSGRFNAARLAASLDAAMKAASSEQLKDLVRSDITRVTTVDRAVVSVDCVPAALPLFAPPPTLCSAPRDGGRVRKLLEK